MNEGVCSPVAASVNTPVAGLTRYRLYVVDGGAPEGADHASLTSPPSTDAFRLMGAGGALDCAAEVVAIGIGGEPGTTSVDASADGAPVTGPFIATTRYLYWPALNAAVSLKLSAPVTPTRTNGPPVSV